MNTFYRLYEQSQDAAMEQVRELSKMTFEELKARAKPAEIREVRKYAEKAKAEMILIKYAETGTGYDHIILTGDKLYSIETEE